jgi:phosphoglycerate dehydrogenase-like enzyme
VQVWIAHAQGRELLGTLPNGINVDIAPDAESLPGDPAGVEFWVPNFGSDAHRADLLSRMSSLRVIQLLSAGADNWTGMVPPGVALCDARGVHDAPVAEWVVGATIGVLRRFPQFARAQRDQEWAPGRYAPTPELTGARVLLVGAGSIGAAIERRLAPFDVTITKVARTARAFEGVRDVTALPDLLPHADVVVLVVPLTEQTRGLVGKEFLAAMPDGALLVNAARGPVVDTAALVAELSTGRLHAALDVTDPEPLPAGHPLWSLPNVFLTPHTGGSVDGFWSRAYAAAGDQLRRYAAGEPLINLVGPEGY